MPIETATTHLVRIELDIPSMMARTRGTRLPVRDLDLGYLVHAQLGALFGDAAPKPFALGATRGRFVEVLGYTPSSTEALEARARASARPDARATCRWESLASKPMPTFWEAGQQFGFKLRVCPVIRMASDGKHHHKGVEVDAFLARCWKVADPSVPVSREETYLQWLDDRFSATGGCRRVQGRMTSHRRTRLLRRTQGKRRRGHLCERPNATIEGILEIVDPPAFEATVRRGIGRHRAFGFGMLLLRPPGRQPC